MAEKEQSDQIEAVDVPDGHHNVSGYESLTWWETVKMFKMTVLICFLVTFSAATDGYQTG